MVTIKLLCSLGILWAAMSLYSDILAEKWARKNLGAYSMFVSVGWWKLWVAVGLFVVLVKL